MNYTDFEIARRFDELDHKAVLAECAQFSIKNVRMAAERVVDAGLCLFVAPEVKWGDAPAWMQEIGDQINHGKRVPAIKGIRSAFMCGLKEALDVVDNLMGAERSGPLTEHNQHIYHAITDAGFVYAPVPPVKADAPDLLAHVYIVVAIYTCEELPEVIFTSATLAAAEAYYNDFTDYGVYRDLRVLCRRLDKS